MLALLAAFVLSLGASAWADTQGLFIKKAGAEYQTVYKVTERVGKEIFIRVRALYGTLTNSGESLSYSTDATKLKWTVTQSPEDGSETEPIEGLTISSVAGTTTSDYALDDVSMGKSEILTATLSGVIRASGTVTITVELMKDTTTSANGTEADDKKKTCQVIFSTDEKDETLNIYFPLLDGETFQTIDIDTDTLDPRDPESVMWNGMFPPFTGLLGTSADTVNKSSKPKVTWPKPKDFTPGVSTDTVVATVAGPADGINVYIAGKDAVKLFGLAKGAADIPLTSANVAQYNIPFRVVEVNTADNKATGDKKTEKDSKTTVTIAFNGGNYALKGYPITVSAWNKNNATKPAAKAVKLNVGDPKSKVVPQWMTKVTSEEITTNGETFTKWQEEYDAQDSEAELKVGEPYVVDYEYTDAAGDMVANATPENFGQTDQGTENAPYYFYFRGNEDHTAGWYALKGDTKVYSATHTEEYPISWAREFDTWNILNPKAKPGPEVTARVNPDDDKDFTDFSETYYVSGDAPLSITTKGGTKVADNLVSFAQPSFDYLGRMTKRGYVKIDGEPKEKKKESKEAVTLTATNPSTKKKGAAKVTAIAKTSPYFEKLATFKYYTDDDETHNRVVTKRVEAGKVPSVKFKAKGSKTITYLLGAYTIGDGDDELYPDGEGIYSYLYDYVHGDDEDWRYDYDEDKYEDIAEAFNAELEAKLAALKLSFDTKKGAIVLANKNDKNTLPTLNASGDAFESLDIVVTAYNGVGTAQAWAHVAITGAKPAVSAKDATISGTVKVGDVIPFTLKAGKNDAAANTEGVNIKATEAADSKVKASSLGVALVTWDSMDVMVSAEVEVKTGALLPAGFNAETDIVGDGSARDASTDDASEIAGRKYAAADMTIKSGDTWVKSADAKYKNQGLLQVVDPAKIASLSSDKASNKGQTIDLALENLGATNKGKIKVIIKNDVKDGGDPTKPVVAAETPATPTPAGNSAKPVVANNGASRTGSGGTYAEADAEADAEAEAEPVVFGAPRNIASLTAQQKAYLKDNGYVVVAVLDEFTAQADGQVKDFEAELDEEKAAEGAKLVYIAFPQNAEESEDDKIADFYDEDGAAIETVPASLKVVVAPWLRSGVTYQPVIAIEADAE